MPRFTARRNNLKVCNLNRFIRKEFLLFMYVWAWTKTYIRYMFKIGYCGEKDIQITFIVQLCDVLQVVAPNADLPPECVSRISHTYILYNPLYKTLIQLSANFTYQTIALESRRADICGRVYTCSTRFR